MESLAGSSGLNITEICQAGNGNPVWEGAIHFDCAGLGRLYNGLHSVLIITLRHISLYLVTSLSEAQRFVIR
jgi:hypothetical protein